MSDLFTLFLEGFISTVVLSIGSGILSPLIVARGMAMMGSAISHSLILVVALASLLGLTDISFIFFLLLMSSVFSIILATVTFKGKVPNDSYLAIFFAATMSLGVIISAYTEMWSQINSILFGNIFLIDSIDVWWSVIVTSVILISFFLLRRGWILTTFSVNFAQTLGVKVWKYHFLFLLLLAIYITTSVKLTGIILVNSMLLAPGVFSFLFAKDLRSTFIYSLLFSIFTLILGLILSSILDFSSGPTLALVQFLTLLLAYIVKILIRMYHERKANIIVSCSN